MEFKEVTKPEFVLKLSLDEAIALWKMANSSFESGNQQAKIFVDVLYDFAENSNSYTEFLD